MGKKGARAVRFGDGGGGAEFGNGGERRRRSTWGWRGVVSGSTVEGRRAERAMAVGETKAGRWSFTPEGGMRGRERSMRGSTILPNTERNGSVLRRGCE